MGTSTLVANTDTEMVGQGEPLLVKLSRIVPLPNQPRKYFDPVSLEDLADDIRDNKQHTPVRLVRNPEKAGEFMLLGGERRWRAFHILWRRVQGDPKREPLVKAFIEVVKDMKELFKLAFLDNLRRENLIPVDEAAAFHQLREDGMSIDAIAALVKKSRGHVDNYLKVHGLPDSVKELMNPDREKDQQLSISQAIDIARGVSPSDPALRLTIALEAIERQLDTAETRMLVEVKVGRNQVSFGGRLRKPSDDYLVLMAFIGRIQATSKRLKTTLHVPSLYQNRANGEEEMAQDAHKLQQAIELLVELKGEFVYRSPPQARKRAS